MENQVAQYDPFEDEDNEQSQINKRNTYKNEKQDFKNFLNDEFSEPNINNLIKDYPSAVELMRKSMKMLKESNWKALITYMKTCVNPESEENEVKKNSNEVLIINFVKNFYMGVGYFKENNYDLALECFKEANKTHTYEQIYYNLALCHLKKNNLEEAVINLDKVLKENKNFFFAHYNLIKIYLKKKNFLEAYVNYRNLFDVIII